MTTTYATVDYLATKLQRTLTPQQQAGAEIMLTEGSALLRHKVAGLDAGMALGAPDPVLVTMVLTDAVCRVMRNPSGSTSQTIGPETATFAGLNASGKVTFTEEEIDSVTPPDAPGGLSVGGFAIGSAALGRPDWTRDPHCPPVLLPDGRWC